MNQEITIELQFFLISILWGALVLLAYDQLRIIRRIIRHNTFFVAVEDLMFWIFTSVFIFAMIYVRNSGTIRGFSVMGMVIGMLIYHYILSDWLVMLISRIILLLLRPFSLAFKYMTKGLILLKKKIRILNNAIYRQLKSYSKSVKIALIKYRKKRNQRAKARLKIDNKKVKKRKHKKTGKPKQERMTGI